MQPYLIASLDHAICSIGSFELVCVQQSFPPPLRHWNSSVTLSCAIFPIMHQVKKISKYYGLYLCFTIVTLSLYRTRIGSLVLLINYDFRLVLFLCSYFVC